MDDDEVRRWKEMMKGQAQGEKQEHREKTNIL